MKIKCTHCGHDIEVPIANIYSMVGAKGGKTRSKNLSAAEMKEIAKKGAAVRWANHKKKSENK